MKRNQANEIIKEVREQYNSMTKEWDISRQVFSSLKEKQLKRFRKCKNILDLGCGNGLVTGEILQYGVKYYGLDISKELIKIARRKYSAEIKNKEANFLVGDACKKLPYKNNFFDGVISFAVLHHVPGEEKRLRFLDEVKRVLKPGGQASVIVWNLFNNWPKKRFGIEEQVKNPKLGLDKNDFLVSWRATPGKEVKRYIHSFTDKELKELARAVGFDKITVGYYNRAGEKSVNGEEIVVNLIK